MSQRRAATRMRMFADVERMDAHAWASYLAPDAVMRLGNELISDYRVYTDIAPVFAGLPAVAAPPVS